MVDRGRREYHLMSGITLLEINPSNTGGGGGGGGGAMTAVIGVGSHATSTTGSNTFAKNTVTVANGGTALTYGWVTMPDTNGTWNAGGTISSYTPSVTGVFSGNVSRESVVCVVTSGTITATSNTAVYSYLNNSTA